MVYSKVKTKATWRKWAVSWKYFLIGSMIHPRAEGVDAGDTQRPTSTAPWAEAAEGTSHRMNLILWSLLGESFFITVTPTQGCSGQSLHRAVSWRTCIITSSLPRSPETSRKCFLTVNPTFSCGRLNSLLLDSSSEEMEKHWSLFPRQFHSLSDLAFPLHQQLSNFLLKTPKSFCNVGYI